MHIIVAGAARAGKTTLSLMLKDEGYVHYKMDSIKRGICEAYNLKYDRWEELSPIMCTIINRMIWDNKTDTNYLKEEYAFDIPFLYPEDIASIDTEDTLPIFLGYADLTAEENFNNIRNHDTDNLWTNHVPDDVLFGMCQQNVEFSRHLQAECLRLGLPYFDTSHEREQVLKRTLNFIEDKKRHHV